jgi:hypothetical protein
MGGFIVNGKLLYVPTVKGQEFHDATAANVLMVGGRGSAKSTTGRWDAHMRAMAHPGFKYAILRRTFPELEKSHLLSLPQEMEDLGGTYNSTAHKAHYPNGSVGFFSHCATDQHVLNLLSSEFYLMFFDEVSTFEWEQFTKLGASVRASVATGITTPLVRAATNPLGPSAMKINEYWVEHSVDLDEDPDYNVNDWVSIRADLKDNPYLDSEQYSKRFSGLPAHVRKAWVDGEFALENSLFDFKPRIKLPTEEYIQYHVIHDMDLEKILKTATIYRAIDAGWFPDPTVCIWFAHLGNRHIAFHEETWYKTTAEEIAGDIREIDKRLGVKTVAMTYCDPSMDIHTTADVKTIKEIYEANGVPMECSINKRDQFATVMHNALAEEAYENVPRLQIYVHGVQGCPMLIRTLPQMRYDEKRTKFMADHKQDHWVIAACYYLLSHSSDPRSSIPGTSGDLPRYMRHKQSHQYYLGQNNVRDRK